SNLIRDENPTYFVAATDVRAKTYRHEIYPEYKANRSTHSDEFYKSVELLYNMLEVMGIPVVGVSGYEADDVIGTICAQNPDIRKYIISSDKDFMQLVDDNTFLYRAGKYPNKEILDIAGVQNKV